MINLDGRLITVIHPNELIKCLDGFEEIYDYIMKEKISGKMQMYKSLRFMDGAIRNESNFKKGRVIFHVDMNSFYASVEMAYNPELKGKPLAIAGNPKERRGIIVTCSYEARKFGVKTTMPVWEAKTLSTVDH